MSEAKNLREAVTRQMAVLQAEANQWKALAAMLVRAHGRQQGGTLVYEVSLGEAVALTDGAWTLAVDKTQDGFRFVLEPEPPAPPRVTIDGRTFELRDPTKFSGWWYLSFAGDDDFLGAAVVEGDDDRAALARSHALGINPGGEVVILPIPTSEMPTFREEFRNRLLSKAEVCEHLDGRALRDVDATAEQVAEVNGGTVVNAYVTYG